MSSARKRQRQQRVAAKIDGLNQAMMLERHHGDVLNTMAIEIARRCDALRALLKECAPHVFSAAEAEHLLDGFRPQRRPLDDLAERVHAALGPNVEFSGGAPLHGAASAGTQGYASGGGKDEA